MCDGGAHHPSTSTFGVSAGAVSPVVANGPHTGAGFFIIDKHGWLAGTSGENIWQSFGGNRNGNESPWQTASREMLEETGIPSERLVSLAPPFRKCKGDHVYVLHIATIHSTHSDSTFPMVTSRELTCFRHLTSFGGAFQSKLADGEIVYRRDIEPAFLEIAAKIYRAVSMRARAAANVSPRLDPSDSTLTVANTAQQPAADASSDATSPQPNGPTTRPSLGNGYAALHSSNFVEHSTASRLHARLVSHRVHILERKRSVAIDARGQLAIDKKGLRKSDTPARRAKLSSDQAQQTLIRRRTGHANHGLSGLPNDPPAQSAAPTGPVQFVPRKTNEFSSANEPPSLMTGDEELPPDDDDSTVDARQPLSETARTSPPLGTSPLPSPAPVVSDTRAEPARVDNTRVTLPR